MKRYTVTLSPDTPEKLVKLSQVLAEVMLKKGFKVRVGTSDADMTVLEKAVLEGNFYSHEPEKFGALCDGVDTPAVHQKALRLFPSMVEASDNLRAQMRRACALVAGSNANEPSKMLVCYSPDGVCRYADLTGESSDLGLLIQAAELSGVPVLNLGRKEHRDRVISLVKQSTKKSAMQSLVQKARRR